MKQQEMYDIIGELNACGAKREIIQIAKKDMENGVDGEKVLDKKNADAVSKDGSGYHYSCHSVDDFGDASDYSSGFVSGSVSVSSSASGYDFERTQEKGRGQKKSGRITGPLCRLKAEMSRSW